MEWNSLTPQRGRAMAPPTARPISPGHAAPARCSGTDAGPFPSPAIRRRAHRPGTNQPKLPKFRRLLKDPVSPNEVQAQDSTGASSTLAPTRRGRFEFGGLWADMASSVGPDRGLTIRPARRRRPMSTVLTVNRLRFGRKVGEQPLRARRSACPAASPLVTIR